MDVAALKGIFAIMISNPFQFLFELLFIYLIRVKISVQKPSDNCKYLSWQLLASAIFLVLLGVTTALCMRVMTYGRPNLVFSTFLYAWILDQVKSIITLALIHMIVVRRFMHLAVNENEYLDLSKIPPK